MQIAFDDIGQNNHDYLSTPYNLMDLYSYSYARGARIHTNSWGPSYPTAEYDVSSMETDRYVSKISAYACT